MISGTKQLWGGVKGVRKGMPFPMTAPSLPHSHTLATAAKQTSTRSHAALAHALTATKTTLESSTFQKSRTASPVHSEVRGRADCISTNE